LSAKLPHYIKKAYDQVNFDIFSYEKFAPFFPGLMKPKEEQIIPENVVIAEEIISDSRQTDNKDQDELNNAFSIDDPK
jgi:hypothetical protein